MPTKLGYTEIWRVFKHSADNPLVQMKMYELSDRLGVSQRTLFCVCKKFTGVGPAAYIRLHRMNLAHEMLERAAGSSDATVSHVLRLSSPQSVRRFIQPSVRTEAIGRAARQKTEGCVIAPQPACPATREKLAQLATV